jgi:hypothetical protein
MNRQEHSISNARTWQRGIKKNFKFNWKRKREKTNGKGQKLNK